MSCNQNLKLNAVASIVKTKHSRFSTKMMPGPSASPDDQLLPGSQVPSPVMSPGPPTASNRRARLLIVESMPNQTEFSRITSLWRWHGKNYGCEKRHVKHIMSNWLVVETESPSEKYKFVS